MARTSSSTTNADYLYFVANGQGRHRFSRTFEEHNRNVARYRRLLAQHVWAQDKRSRGGGTLERKPNAKRWP